MGRLALSCDMCHERTRTGVNIGLVWVCPACAQKVSDSALQPIPAGCVYRYFFADYLYRTGRLNEE